MKMIRETSAVDSRKYFPTTMKKKENHGLTIDVPKLMSSTISLRRTSPKMRTSAYGN